MRRYIAHVGSRQLPRLAVSSTRVLGTHLQCRLRHTVARPRSSTPKASFNVVQTRSYAEQIVKVPEMAESISEGTLKQFTKKVGDSFEQDEELATIETDKIDVAVNAPAAGVVKELLVNDEDTVTVGQDLIKFDAGGSAEGGKKQDASSEPKEAASKDQETASDSGKVKEPEPSKDSKPSEPSGGAKSSSSEAPSPLTLDNKQDTEKAPPAPKSESKSSEAQPKKPAPKEESKPKQPASSSGGREEHRVKMNRMRLRIAERLKQSQNTAASLTTMNQVDMSAVMELRKKYKDEILKKTGVKFGFMSAFTRACVLAMKDVPAVNASMEGPGGGDTIVWRDYVDVSVAVATEKGLVTPVVRNAESMTMVEIEQSIAELGKKARDNKLTIEDMAGGTFTISNGGVFGSLVGTPIINLPQTAVLGLHAIKDTPWAVNGKVEVRPIMWLALTYDHRILDGREAVTFLVKVKEYIEDPAKMLLF